MRLTGLQVGDRPDPWRRAGFHVNEGARPHVVVGGVRLDLVGGGSGVRGWTLADADRSGPPTIDGLPTTWGRASDPGSVRHPNGATLIDHVVVATPDAPRSIEVFRRELGLEVRRQTKHELSKRRMIQTFFVLKPTIVEMLSPLEPSGDGACAFWGLAFTVDDLDATKARLKEALSDPKDAVQPGRRIATLRTDQLGITVPIAFMTPRV